MRREVFCIKILIAEDEAEILTFYRLILESEGYQVFTTIDGEACLEAYKKELRKVNADQLPLDLVILDQRMPKMSGAQVAKEILKLSPNQQILIITAYKEHPELEDHKLKKIQKLEKPIDPDYLLTIISKLLEPNK